MKTFIRRDNALVPFIVKSGNIARGTIRTMHIGTTDKVACGHTPKDARRVGSHEFTGQYMVCQRCADAYVGPR